MSEPVSNAEVEDVLASIRRLVSEEKRPSGTSAFDAPSVSNLASDVTVETRSKLVLTPALRVAQPVEDQPEPASVEQTNKDEEKSVAEQEPDDEASSADAKLENVTDDFADEPVDPPSLTAADPAEETVESAQDHIEDAPFMHADSDEDEPGRTFVFGRLVAEDEPENAFQAGDSDTQTIASAYLVTDEQQFDIGFNSDSDADTANVAEVLEPEELLSEDMVDDADVEEDIATAEDMATIEDETNVEDAATEEDGANAEITPIEPAHETPTESDVITPENLRPGIDVPISLSAKIAALEAVIGKRPDQWEPDGVDQDAYSGTEDPTMAWEDHAPGSEFYGAPEGEDSVPEVAAQEETLEGEPLEVEADAQAVVDDITEDEVEPAEDEAKVDTDQTDNVEDLETAVIEEVISSVEDEAAKSILAADVDVLDEEVLRDMVADIVRQELQGALGERITRNVRKLVRREIHRALATQDLE